MSPSIRSRRAFTLVETLVTISVMGLLAAVSVSRINAIEDHQRVSRAINALQNRVQTAFSLAVREGHPVRFAWSSSALKFSVTNRGGDTTYRQVALGTDPFFFKSSEVTVSRTPLEVYPNGLANDTLRVTITSNGVTKVMRVSQAGLVVIQ